MKSLFALTCLLMLVSCGSKKEEPTASSSGSQPVDAADAPVLSTPLKDRSKGGETLFTKLEAKDTGVSFVNPLKDPTTHPLRRLYASSMVVGGVAVGDVDGDDRPDLFFVNGPTKNGLFRQTADFTFEDITAKAGVDGGTAWGVGTAMVDIENDGDLDIYVCNHGTPNQLFLNDGKGAFTESAKAFGIALTEASHTPAFCDYDLDGNLDLYLLTNKYYHPNGKLPNNTPVATMTKNGKVALRPEFEPYVKITNVRFPPRRWIAHRRLGRCGSPRSISIGILAMAPSRM